MNTKYLLGFVFVLLWVNNFGQAPIFEALKVLKNTNEVQINAIAQDTSGFIWLGTNYGAVKYDGVEFKLYSEIDGLSSSQVSCIEVDQKTGIIWLGHTNGTITYVDDNQFYKFNPEEGLSTKEISSILIDNSGMLWFTTLDEGVYYFTGDNRQRLYNVNTDNGLLDNYVYSIIQLNDSVYYMATDKGISAFNAHSNTFFDHITTADGLPDNLVKKLICKDNTLWIGMNDGGVCSYNVKHRSFGHLSPWDFGSLTDFAIIDSTEIWVATQKKGVIQIKFDEKQMAWYHNYDKQNGLVDNRINRLFTDRENNVWIGTQKGLSLRKNNNIEFFNTNSGFNLTNIFGITIDHQNRFWLATQDGLFNYFRDNMGNYSTHKIINEPKFENAIYISVYTDVQGYIWVGTYGFGALRINPKDYSYQQITIQNGLNSNDIFNITGDSTQIWLSTAGGGVSILRLSNLKEIKNYTVNDGLPSNYIYFIYLENGHKAWVATDGGGVGIIEDGVAYKYINDAMDTVSNKIYSILKSPGGNMWFNLADNGLFMVNNNQSKHYNEITGLTSNTTQSIICNVNDQLIAINNSGINILNQNQQNIIKYGEETNLSNLEPNLNAVFSDKNHNIYIGTTKGIIKLINQNADTTLKPRLLITSKRLFLKNIPNDHKKFKHRENNLSFGFTALWFKSAQNLVYRYKLEGYDIDWSVESPIRTVTYPKLPDGQYQFRVQVKLDNGDWYETEKAQFTFTIRPPFYKTIWFILAAIITAIIAVYGFVVYRTRKLINDKLILENEVKKRTYEINMQKDEIEAQRDEIEAQRNFVMEQKDQIEIQNKDIKSSIQYASRIQHAVLPPNSTFDTLLKDYFIFFKPRDIVSGDFYYLNIKDNRIIVAAADCTGHGVPGAFMSLLGVSLLNQIVGWLPINYNASTILNKLRDELKIALRQTGKRDETKDGLDISLCVIDKQNSILEYAGAFNPLIMVRNKEILVFKADKMPIGVYIGDENLFTNHTIDLQPNDMLYLFSDGFQDQFGGEQNRKFLAKNLREFLLEISHLNTQEQFNQLEIKLNAWKGKLGQLDDILILGVRI